MKKYLGFISLILSVVMISGMIVACAPKSDVTTDATGTDAQTSKETEQGKTTEAVETNKTTEYDVIVESDTEEVQDTSPLELEDVDYAPDYKEYETESFYNDEPINIRVEADSYVNCTIPWTKTSGPEFSDGAMMVALLSGETNLPLGMDGEYFAEYKVTIPKTGEYSLSVLAGTNNADWTTDFKLEINGKKEIFISEAVITGAFASDTLGQKSLLKYMDMGSIELEEGENTIRMTLVNSDLETIQWGPRMSSYVDYFEISRGTSTEPVVSLGYDVSLRGVENSELVAGAAKVHVFDRRFPLKLSFTKFFPEAGEQEYSIIDFFGETLISGKVQGEQFDYVTLEKSIKNHPTGYFKFIMGDYTLAYVVTPPLNERKYSDTPFAMDFASYYKAQDINDTVALASAARLAGVTWVRDRSHWSSYEKVQGEYTFGTDRRFSAIQKTGLNLLNIFYVSPDWAIENLGETKDRVGGFADTQLEVYNMMKALTEHYSGVVDAWEIWNESDGGFAMETAEQYTAWHKAATLGAIAGDPNVIISHGGFCVPNEHKIGNDANGNPVYSDYVHLSLMNDLLKYTSVFNYHSHTSQSGDLYNIDFRATGMTKLIYPTMALYGALDIPVWVSEAGMRMESETPTDDMKLAQTSYIVTSAVQSLGMGTDKHFWFLLAPILEGGGDFGTFSANFEPYPTLAAEAIMTKVLGRGQYVGELSGLSGHETLGPFSAVFNTGTRYASVLWMRLGKYEYTFDAELPVIVTDIMGNETLLEPVDGKITVTVGEDPIYITYSKAPAFLEKVQEKVKTENLEFTASEKIVISPEFENFNINDTSIKAQGHVISDGLKIKVRVSNFNDFAITGTVDATLKGFIVEGYDKEITVQPYSEAYVTLTLKRTSGEAVNGYMTFTGNFNGEETTKAVAHVRTEGAARQDCSFTFGVVDGKTNKKDKLSNIKVSIDGAKGDIVVLLDETVVETIQYDEATGKLSIDISDIEEGSYILTVAVKDESGYYDFAHLHVFYDNGEVVFRFPGIKYLG